MADVNDEENAMRSVALQNAQSIFLARQRAERELAEAKEALQRKTEEAALHREWFRVTLSSIGDGVITTDVAGAVTFLNPVAEKLTGWSAGDAQGQPLEAVFKIISEATLQPAANPIAEVLRDGVIVAMANHTSLIARDGTTRAIEDSTAPIRDGDGKLIGAVMVFHDVTGRRGVEDALAERAKLGALRADVSAALISGESLPATLQQCAEALVRHLDGAFARIWTLNQAGGVLELRASAGLYTHLDGPHSRVKLGEFKIGRIAQSGQPLLTNDVLNDPNISDLEWARKEGLVAFAGFPLMLDGAVVGVMAMFARHPLSSAVLGDLAPIAEALSQWVQRKRAEDALRASEERFRALFTSMDEGFSIVEVLFDHAGHPCDHRFLDVNPAFEKQTGIKNPIGKTARELVPGIEQHWHDLYGRVATTGESVRTEKKSDALGRWYDFNAVRIGEEPSRKVAVVFNDITDRKRAEESLRESEARFRSLGDSIPQLVWSANADGFIYWYNRRWYEYTGTSPEEMEGWGWQSVHDPAVLPSVLAKWQAAIASGEVFEMEFPLRGTDGIFRTFLTRVIPQRDAGGNVTQWFGTNTDISSRIESENMLRAARDTAEAANRAKDNFLAALSHELRTPLTPVLMTASALREDQSIPPHVRDQLAMIERNVALEARLIDDLLDLTRISRGKLTLRTEPCDMHSLIGHVAEMIREEAREKKIALDLELLAQRSSLTGDPARLQQIFWNLLRNAVKFTPAGGHIRIQTRDASACGGQPESRFCIEVSDDGIGLERAVIERIFEPFEQASSDQDHRFGGLGLGLAIARAIVVLHHGTIRAESAGPGCGSTFIVELPGSVAQSAASRASSGAGDGDPQIEPPMRLLVVEDHEATLQVLTRLLTRAGHRIVGATNLTDARAAAAKEPFDAVISDLGLPDGTGIELMEDLHARYGLRGIVLSGYGMEEDLRRSRQAGFVAHLVKPVDVNELRRALRLLASVPPGGG